MNEETAIFSTFDPDSYVRLWWFWDEPWAQAHGPYESKEKAREMYVKYFETR